MHGPFLFCKKQIRLQKCANSIVAAHKQSFINDCGGTWIERLNVDKILKHFWDAKTEAP